MREKGRKKKRKKESPGGDRKREKAEISWFVGPTSNLGNFEKLDIS